jgi:hypothetical protein
MSEMGIFRQLEPDARFVCLDERKKPLCNRLGAFVVHIVTAIKFRETLFIIPGHRCVDCL